MKKLITCLCIIGFTMSAGCATKLNHAMHAANDALRASDKAFDGIARAYQGAAEKMANSKHQLQQSHIDRDWQDFLDKHTDAGGNLVSKDKDGKIVPLSAATLLAAMDARSQKQLQLKASQDAWALVDAPFTTLINKHEAAVDVNMKTEADAIQALDSAQAAFEAGVSAVGGALGAIGVPAILH